MYRYVCISMYVYQYTHIYMHIETRCRNWSHWRFGLCKKCLDDISCKATSHLRRIEEGRFFLPVYLTVNFELARVVPPVHIGEDKLRQLLSQCHVRRVCLGDALPTKRAQLSPVNLGKVSVTSLHVQSSGVL